jgi:hypothetical protein
VRISFFFSFFVIPVSPWRLATASIAFFVEVLHAPLSNICAVPATTLKHDQACIRRSACLMPHTGRHIGLMVSRIYSGRS